MPVSESRRNEYSEQFHFRLSKEDSERLKQIMKKEQLTLVGFIRQSLANYKPSK